MPVDERAREAARLVLLEEADGLGRRPLVSEPVVRRINGHGFEVRPCSGMHRALWLSGYVVLSCSRCSWERTEKE